MEEEEAQPIGGKEEQLGKLLTPFCLVWVENLTSG
jgi:hypothetical protein